MSFRGPNKSFL